MTPSQRRDDREPPATLAASTDILAGLRAASERAYAASPTPPHTVDLRFAGRAVRMRVAGPELAAQLTRSFAPLRAPVAGAPLELLVDAWDRAHTGVGHPGVPFEPDTVDPLGGGLFKQFGGGTVLHFERARDVAALDRARRHLFFCVRDARASELHLRSKPFPDLLATWYRDRGVQQAHAALVAREGHGVLFVGSSGAGKSTCALACALRGFAYLGDDAIGIEVTGDACVGHALYAGARVDDSMIARFPTLAPYRIAPIGRWERKGLVFLSEVDGCTVVPSTHISAVVVPDIRGGPGALAPIPPSHALRRLAPSSLLVPLGGRAPALAALAALVRRTPCFQMAIGDDVAEIPVAIERLLSEMHRRGDA